MISAKASIVTYNTDPKILCNCIESILASSIDITVTVIDNSKNKKLKEIVEKYDCNYFSNPSNPGYGAAHNISIRESIEQGIEYHFVLNPDIYFVEDILKEIIDYMDINEKVGLLMPRIIYPDKSIQYLCKLIPRPVDLFLRMIIPKKFRKSFDYNFELRWTGYNKVMKVPYLSGCFLVFRIETLKDIGLFDERFFMYPEDIDISRRIAKKWDTIYYPFCTAVHLYGGASKRSLKMFKIHVINIVRYFNKWGWLFDNDRRIINNQILRDLEIKKINKHK